MAMAMYGWEERESERGPFEDRSVRRDLVAEVREVLLLDERDLVLANDRRAKGE